MKFLITFPHINYSPFIFLAYAVSALSWILEKRATTTDERAQAAICKSVFSLLPIYIIWM